jgi:ankyrin repeat protein
MSYWVFILAMCFTAGSEIDANELIQAVQAGNLRRVEVLIDSGMDVNACDASGKTPLVWAVERGNLDLVSLMPGGSMKPQKRYNAKPTMWGSTHVYQKIAKLLIRQQEVSHKLTRTQKERDRQLINAIISGQSDQVEKLLESGVSPNVTDRGRSALMWAACRGQMHMVACLIDSGARVNQRDAYGFTVYLWAKEQGHEEVAALILDHIYDVLPTEETGRMGSSIGTRAQELATRR